MKAVNQFNKNGIVFFFNSLNNLFLFTSIWEKNDFFKKVILNNKEVDCIHETQIKDDNL